MRNETGWINQFYTCRPQLPFSSAIFAIDLSFTLIITPWLTIFVISFCLFGDVDNLAPL